MALIIGDIHGYRHLLDDILAFVNPPSNTTVITLGDYIDRGPDSKGVFDTLIALRSEYNLVTLKGNHDVFMELAPKDPAMHTFWLRPDVGGTPTLDSYGGEMENIPESHWKFLAEAPLYYEAEDFICVHGGVDPDIPMDQQAPETLLEKRFRQAEAHQSGKLVICGHTRQLDGSPRLVNNTLCIDTNVFGGGYLTAYDTDTKTFYQVNDSGEKLSFGFDELGD